MLTSDASLTADIKIVPSILVVDDREENLIATERVLRPLGAKIFRASSGREALSLALHHSFAVVIMDVQMPDMDGFETASLMQDSEYMRNVPIIFATAISKEEKYVARAAEIGAADYIFKPINPDILRSKIKVYIDIFIQREQLSNFNKVLVQSNEELERFAYICSHDMQEPVRMMNIFGTLLKGNCEKDLDEKGRDYLNLIVTSAKRLHIMISDILNFSRVGREDVRLETVDCNVVANEVISELAPLIEEKKAQVICGPLPTLETSATLVRILLQNFINNGIKFQDGSRAPQISIEAKAQGHAWLFSVRDNGIGIDPQYHEKIFTIFHRLHNRDTYPGTGIGLSTCRKFIQLCGGTIYFDSQPGEGTTFYFTLPERAGPPAQG